MTAKACQMDLLMLLISHSKRELSTLCSELFSPLGKRGVQTARHHFKICGVCYFALFQVRQTFVSFIFNKTHVSPPSAEHTKSVNSIVLGTKEGNVTLEILLLRSIKRFRGT